MGKFCLVLVLSMLLISGCKKEQATDISQVEISSSENFGLINYQYEELGDKLIYWNEIYLFNLDHFYVYFFSRTCGHCEKIRNLVLPILLKRRIYFACEASNEHKICMYPETGNLNEISLCILGYPTIAEFKSGSLVKYASGENEVLSFLNSK